MRWVNDTLPPRPRRRWLLMTVRLSMSSFAGIARTLVAVGTARLACMLVTTRAAAPLSWRWVGDGADDPLCGWEALSPSLVPRSVAPLLPTPLPRAVGSVAFAALGLLTAAGGAGGSGSGAVGEGPRSGVGAVRSAASVVG